LETEHLPFPPQIRVRQTSAASPAVHGPLPSGNPHLPSSWQLLAMQSSAASQVAPMSSAQVELAALQRPLEQAALTCVDCEQTSCRPSAGNALPLWSLAVQVNVSRRQNSALSHSSSFQQLWGASGMHFAPEALHTPVRQSAEAVAGVQGPSPAV
jgi:hypothetical protein